MLVGRFAAHVSVGNAHTTTLSDPDSQDDNIRLSRGADGLVMQLLGGDCRVDEVASNAHIRAWVQFFDREVRCHQAIKVPAPSAHSTGVHLEQIPRGVGVRSDDGDLVSIGT